MNHKARLTGVAPPPSISNLLATKPRYPNHSPGRLIAVAVLCSPGHNRLSRKASKCRVERPRFLNCRKQDNALIEGSCAADHYRNERLSRRMFYIGQMSASCDSPRYPHEIEVSPS